jgi:hypothetical protein
MEKRLSKKIDEYTKKFKDSIKTKMSETGMTSEESTRLLQFIYDYEKILIDENDFKKRKRTKNHIPLYDRCCAKRATNEQCTRRKKEGFNYCGTHIKGTPHGIVLQNSEEGTLVSEKVEVWAQDISGIIYYIDSASNVYDTEDIALNKTNPKVIAKYEKTLDGEYSIPLYNI